MNPDERGALAASLEAIASPTRLELLGALRLPQALHEIRVSSISRQAISRQLDILVEADLVRRSAPAGTRGATYVLNHERLFALVDAMRELTKLRPFSSVQTGETLDGARDQVRDSPRPRLVVTYGRDDGAAFPLTKDASQWRVGRAPECEIRLDYDPYLSAHTCVLERVDAAIHVRDLGSRNGTWVNGERLAADSRRLLAPGDILGVGHSSLVYQA